MSIAISLVNDNMYGLFFAVLNFIDVVNTDPRSSTQ